MVARLPEEDRILARLDEAELVQTFNLLGVERLLEGEVGASGGLAESAAADRGVRVTSLSPIIMTSRYMRASWLLRPGA